MSSILNSISAGELEVQQAPQVKPVKEDSIIDLIQDVEIEFDSCSKLEENLNDVIDDLMAKAIETRETLVVRCDE